MSNDLYPSDLEERFQPPEGWRWHTFEHEGRKLRFGTVAPKDRIPDAIVIGLQGVNEFTEKYFETARDMLGRNLSFWMMDWFGQGQSGRSLSNPKKRHSNGFDNDIEDLHYFIMEYVKHSAVHPDVGRIPLVMMAHSMGANIGLRYLNKYPQVFACAALSAPMFGIYALRFVPKGLRSDLTTILKSFFDTNYAPGGGTVAKHVTDRHRLMLTHDPLRGAVAPAWQALHPNLTDGITIGWLYEAVKSCAITCQPDFLKAVRTPMIIGIPGYELLVDNKETRAGASLLPNCLTVELPASSHEILMESDETRTVFLNAFDDLLKRNDIKSQLKPF